MNHLKSLTSEPTAILIPYFNSANELFHKILHMLPNRPVFGTQLMRHLMEVLLQYIQSYTTTNFKTTYKYFPEAPAMIEDLQNSTSIYGSTKAISSAPCYTEVTDYLSISLNLASMHS